MEGTRAGSRWCGWCGNRAGSRLHVVPVWEPGWFPAGMRWGRGGDAAGTRWEGGGKRWEGGGKRWEGGGEVGRRWEGGGKAVARCRNSVGMRLGRGRNVAGTRLGPGLVVWVQSWWGGAQGWRGGAQMSTHTHSARPSERSWS